MKRLKVCVVFTLISVMLGACSASEPVNQGSQGVILDNSQEDNIGQADVTYEDETKTVINDNKYEWNDKVQLEGITYQLVSVQCTQQLDGRDEKKVNYLTDKIDENGNLFDSEWFIWMKIKIKNEGAEQEEVIVNTNTFVNITNENVVTETGAEAVYISPEQSEEQKEIFHCILNAGEEREVELGYQINENNVSGNLYYCIGYGGSSIDGTDNKFLNVEEFWNEK